MRAFQTTLATMALAFSATHAFAQTTEPAPITPIPAKAEVAIPFNPPLGVPVRYKVSKARVRDGKATASGSYVERITFTKRAGGYLMRWQWEGNSLANAEGDTVLKVQNALWATPIDFETDADGTVQRVRDWPVVQARLKKQAEVTIASVLTPAQRQAMQGAMNAAIAPLYQGSAEDAPTVILKNLLPGLGWGGSSFSDGQQLDQVTLVPTPLSPTPLKANVVTKIGPISPVTITITSETKHDQALLSSAMKDYFDRILASMPAEQRAKAEANMPKDLKIDLTDKSRFVIDMKTGLPQLFSNERAMVMAGQGSGGETQTTERLP